MIPEHSTQARCFWLGVDFGEGGKPEKKSGWDRLKPSSRTIAEVGCANEQSNTNLTSPVTHSDINPVQQDRTCYRASAQWSQMTSKCGKNKKVAWESIKKNINIIHKIKFKIYTYTNACILGRVYVVERSTFIWLKNNNYSSWSGPLSVVLYIYI